MRPRDMLDTLQEPSQSSAVMDVAQAGRRRSARASSPIGAGLGIGRIGAAANEGIARQPEAAGDIRGGSIILAALIEGVALFAVVVTLLIALE